MAELENKTVPPLTRTGQCMGVYFPPNRPTVAGPEIHDAPGVTYLSFADQEALPYRILKLIPSNHFGRKNVGYLYAIYHGAKVR